MKYVVERAQDVRRNEFGMETVHSVALTGVAAIAMAGLYQWKWAILAWVQSCLTLFFKIPL